MHCQTSPTTCPYVNRLIVLLPRHHLPARIPSSESELPRLDSPISSNLKTAPHGTRRTATTQDTPSLPRLPSHGPLPAHLDLDLAPPLRVPGPQAQTLRLPPDAPSPMRSQPTSQDRSVRWEVCDRIRTILWTDRALGRSNRHLRSRPTWTSMRHPHPPHCRTTKLSLPALYRTRTSNQGSTRSTKLPSPPRLLLQYRRPLLRQK
jgi:hypothetical protein